MSPTLGWHMIYAYISVSIILGFQYQCATTKKKKNVPCSYAPKYPHIPVITDPKPLPSPPKHAYCHEVG